MLNEATHRVNGTPLLTSQPMEAVNMAPRNLSSNAKTSKLCRRCNLSKPASDFYKYRYVCKPCTIERISWRQKLDKEGRHLAQRKYYQKNKDDIRGKIKKYRTENREKHLASARLTARKRRLQKMGISEADLIVAIEAQQGVCAICQSRPVRADTDKYSHIDHCHSTGKFRGILCNQCNTGLGRFSDSPETLIRAVSYLRGELIRV